MAKKSTRNEQIWPGPPEDLNEWSKERWRRYVGSKLQTSGSIDLLETALRSHDLAERAEEIVNREGYTITTEKSGVPHVHPLLKTVREHRQLFMKCWKVLNLHWVNGDSLLDDLVNGNL